MFDRKPKNKKLLPFATPLTDVYPHHAVAFGVLQNNIYDLPALLTNYIQLVYDMRIERMDFSIGLDILSYMKDIPLLFCHQLDREFVFYNWKNFSDFLKNCINNGYYVHCLVDTFYIAAYEECYNRNHMYHNITVYGYDEQKRTFYTADSFVHGKFVNREVTMAELDKAFFPTRANDWLDGILLYRVKEDPYIGIGYDTVYMKNEIQNYLDGTASGEISLKEKRRRIPENYVYGIQVYDSLCSYLDLVMEEDEKIDIRLISVLVAHKEVLLHIIDQLHSISLLDEVKTNRKNIRTLLSRLEAVSGKMLKYNILRDFDMLRDIQETLYDIKNEDYETMEFLYETIRTSPKNIVYSKKDNDNSCVFEEKTVSQYGNWQGNYGEEGYHLIGYKKKLPEYLKKDNYTFRYPIYVLLRRQYGEQAALHVPGDKETRLIGYYLNEEEFSIELHFEDDKEHKVTFYCVDYDQLERCQMIEIVDGDTGECLDKKEIENFHYGVYLKYRLKGHIVIKFRKLEGPDAVLSGVFFD